MRNLKMISLIIYQAKVNPKVNPKKGKKTTSYFNQFLFITFKKKRKTSIHRPIKEDSPR